MEKTGYLFVEKNAYGNIELHARIHDERYMPEWTDYPVMIHHGSSVKYAERKYRRAYDLTGAKLEIVEG